MRREGNSPIFETLPVNHVRSAAHQTRTRVPRVKAAVREVDDADDEDEELSSEEESIYCLF